MFFERRLKAAWPILPLLFCVACGANGEEQDSRIEVPPAPMPTTTAMPVPSLTASTTREPVAINGQPPPGDTGPAPTMSAPPPPPPPPPDDTACGGCSQQGYLRCDAGTATCVECLDAGDCAYGSRQQCIGGLCTNVDTSVTICPATRPEDQSSCGLSGYTCIYGTAGKYSCRCGLGAPIGGGTIEATIWMCEVLP